MPLSRTFDILGLLVMFLVATTSPVRAQPRNATLTATDARNLRALTEAYPLAVTGLRVTPRGDLFLVMRDGSLIEYDDGRAKTFDEKLTQPDVEDMFFQAYPPGPVQDGFLPDQDPGRFRNEAFSKSVHGASAGDVEATLGEVDFCGEAVQFSARNGAAAALSAVARELDELLAHKPELQGWVFPLGGTYKWRLIAETNRLSAHSFGTAIDLNPDRGAYWLWSKNATEADIARMRKEYPAEVVAIFERHGFIWGGKWSHFDLMHFEYRPELIPLPRLQPASDLASADRPR